MLHTTILSYRSIGAHRLVAWKAGPGLDGGDVEFTLERESTTGVNVLKARQSLEDGDYIINYKYDDDLREWVKL